jgi:hypothetical protein
MDKKMVVAVAATAVMVLGGGGAAYAAPGSRGGLPHGSETVKLDPADFSVNIDNPYWPMSPGSKWVYSQTDTKGVTQKIVVEVTDKTKMIANGIEARVVRDTATENGELTEQTYDWYAQDKAGNIWYLGEATAEYENGKVATRAGSFEAGVDGAQPGIAMTANPQPGLSYRQEYYKGEAEDKASVITVGAEQVQVPFGYFNKDVLMTRDLVPTEPKVQELKFYAPNVGPLLSVHTDGAGGRAELVSYSHAGTASAVASAAATATPAATASSNASPLAETGGAFPLTPLAPLALLVVLVGTGVLAFGVVRRA